MMRYKTLIDRRLHARTLPTQKTEAAAGCKVINSSFRYPSMGERCPTPPPKIVSR
jgi:hypothetical protein